MDSCFSAVQRQIPLLTLSVTATNKNAYIQAVSLSPLAGLIVIGGFSGNWQICRNGLVPFMGNRIRNSCAVITILQHSIVTRRYYRIESLPLVCRKVELAQFAAAVKNGIAARFYILTKQVQAVCTMLAASASPTLTNPVSQGYIQMLGVIIEYE